MAKSEVWMLRTQQCNTQRYLLYYTEITLYIYTNTIKFNFDSEDSLTDLDNVSLTDQSKSERGGASCLFKGISIAVRIC